MGTNADKRARQRENRGALNQARQEVAQKEKRRSQITMAAVAVVIVAAIAALVFFVFRGDSEPAPSTTTTAASDTDAGAPPADGDAAELPAPPKGITLTEATECPPADGSAERVQVFAGPPPECLTPGAAYTATFSTTEGDFTAELDVEAAPKAVNNFVVLSRFHYYDGVPFHRIVPGFVIQAGDGDGEPWGNNDLGYSIEDELPADSSAYADYSLAMANSGPDTNGSQFFVVLPDGGGQLQPLYSFFGQVTQGTEVVDTIGGLGNAMQEPTKAVLINSVTINETK